MGSKTPITHGSLFAQFVIRLTGESEGVATATDQPLGGANSPAQPPPTSASQPAQP
jgi:hypothetical protein